MTLAARSICARRGGRLVLQDINAQLDEASITAICGPNGAGKSSLLLALAGLLELERGQVMLHGRGLAGLALKQRAREIGYLPQSAQIAWDVAVENLVRLGRMPYRDRGDEPVERAIAAMDLAGLRHRTASTLSGGEKARALLARVLAGEPQWILADEPLSALDLSHQLALMVQLRACADAASGIVLVLHDLAMAMNHADRVLVMKEGRLVADGPPEDTLSSEVIAEVWGVTANWLGERGGRALVVS